MILCPPNVFIDLDFVFIYMTTNIFILREYLLQYFLLLVFKNNKSKNET